MGSNELEQMFEHPQRREEGRQLMTPVTTALSRTPRTPRLLGRSRSGHASARPSAPLRLTRRGRLLFRGLPLMLSVAALTATAAFFAGVMLSPPAVSADVASEDLVTVTVMPGDSLWSIARDAAPGVDPYVTMERIGELNALEGGELELGQELYLPPVR